MDPGAVEGAPQDPSSFAADLEKRLKAGEGRFPFFIQFRTDPATMPLDQATVRWEESASPVIQVADLIFPDGTSFRGQASYGENLSWNIWRVTADHKPEGSKSEARRTVYAASAQLRRNANGLPTGEPVDPRPALRLTP